MENVQSYGIFDKSGFGEVMTLVNDNPTILECMWIVLRICNVISILLNLPMILHAIIMREETMVVEIFMLLNYLSLCWDHQFFIPLLCICYMFIVLIICLLIKFLCIGSMLDLNVFVICFMMLSLCSIIISHLSMVEILCLARGVKQ